MNNISKTDSTFAENVAEKTSQLKEDLQDGYENVKKSGQEYVDEAVKYVEDNPLKATLLAGLIGVVLGLLMKK